ncbi:BT_3987 domain-containing protein [Sphingobacterium lactis]|uniref:F5/8 type C domain-containing protein n=1 Tax=Sphingobacterium lactis TaxID=797291 RepID=A0A1H5WGF0_9SPHI|nr:DUF1735 domain-containing protein [Sphingobacterium lactis]SEF98554.1 protein of unknown function [Sphingobacterium lactis]
MKRLKFHMLSHTQFLVLFACSLFLMMSSCKKENLGELEDIAKDLGEYQASSIGEATSTYLGDSAIRNLTKFAPFFVPEIKEAGAEPTVIAATIDLSLLKFYDSLNYVKSLPFPQKAFRLKKNTVVVEENATKAKDSLIIELQDGSGLTANSVYVIPLRLQVESGPGQLKGKVMFVKMRLLASYIRGKMETFSRAKNFYNLTGRNPYIYGQFQNLMINGQPDAGNTVAFSAKISEAVPTDVVSKVKVDRSPETLAYFAKAINAQVEYVPDGAYKILKDSVTIKENQWSSQDSFKVEIDYSKLDASGLQKNYVLAVRLEDKSRPGLLAPDSASKGDLAFIQIKHTSAETKNIAIGNDGLTGTEMKRSQWVATSTEADTENPAKNVLDGKIETYWKSEKYVSAAPQSLILNLGAQKKVKGFFFTPQYDDTYNDFRKIRVFSSQDGTNWNYEGYYMPGGIYWDSSIENPDIKTLRFLKPVDARYFKFEVMESINGNTAIAEVKGIE